MNPYFHPHYPYNNHYHHPKFRQFPPVDPSMFMHSAQKSLPYIHDANKIMTHIKQSEAFSRKLMSAAQESKTAEVEKMIKDLIQTNPDITFTPSSLTILFTEKNNNAISCCRMVLNVRWQ